MSARKIAIVCGGRNYSDTSTLNKALDEMNIGILIQGGASGADRLAKHWAERNGIPYIEVPALWKAEGRGAGPKRNSRMAKIALSIHKDYEHDVICVAFPGGKGTESMTNIAENFKIKVIKAGE